MNRNFHAIVLGLGMLLTAFSSTMVSASSPLNLMPFPSEIELQNSKFTIPATLNLSLTGISESRQALIQQQLSKLSAVSTQATGNKNAPHIVITVSQPQLSLIPKLNDHESYQLQVTPSLISIKSHSERGVLHGIQTLLQLVDWHKSTIPAVAVNDQPRFPWRGLLIDSARHFMPVDTIKRQLRGMASAKLNVFHWHLTDDQGWRIESLAYPKLHLLASDGLYYTRQQIQDVVAYATLLGIRVVPEFDVPGHASAIAVAYPELISKAGEYHMQRHWGVFEPLLDPSNSKVYEFIRTMVAELAELFPDPYLHIGGDEINPKQWQQSPAIQRYMAENNLVDEHALHTHFNLQLQQILAKHGKRMMGWDEIFHTDLPKDSLVQSWRGLDSLHHIAQSGYQGLLSTGFYIDQPQYADYHYRNDPLLSASKPTFTPSQINQWQQWQFTMPRLKGSAVSGELTLFTTKDDDRHGFIQLNNQQARKLNGITRDSHQGDFWLDTWMGPMAFNLDLGNAQQLSGRILIGNTPYPIKGKLIANGKDSKKAAVLLSQVSSTATLTNEQEQQLEQHILGGEATIWSELVTDDNLDLRIWPRLYVIAERLWSPVELNDKDDMYRRLAHMQDYADNIVELASKKQQIAGLKSLTSEDADIEPLLVLAEAIEQAQYYTRHHSKFQNNDYHQLVKLNQFVDYLPAQSLTLVQLNHLIEAYSQGEVAALTAIEQQFSDWQHNLPRVSKIITTYPKLETLSPIIEDLKTALAIGQQLISHCTSRQPLASEQAQAFRQQLWKIAEMQQEMVISSALTIERLLDACQTQQSQN